MAFSGDVKCDEFVLADFYRGIDEHVIVRREQRKGIAIGVVQPAGDLPVGWRIKPNQKGIVAA